MFAVTTLRKLQTCNKIYNDQIIFAYMKDGDADRISMNTS